MGKYSFALISATFIIAIVFTTSCVKETGCTDPRALNYKGTAVVEDGSCIYGGCTDRDSKNYDPNADVDDGSCTYEGSVVFWYGKSTSIGLMNAGVTSLTYYVDGVIVGSSASNIYWGDDKGPSCGTTGSITVDKDLGNVKSRPYSFSVRDQYNYEYWDGILNIDANTCLRFELTWIKRKKK